MTLLEAVVDVATMWTAPDAPRLVDAPAVADSPNLEAWTKTLDIDSRRGLHGRTLTQLLRGEPVHLLETGPAGWVRVAAPWQPAPDDPRGYPGWVRAAHLGSAAPAASKDQAAPAGRIAHEPSAVLAHARQFLGVSYLWGGMNPEGLDCSGLVHVCFREAGLVVPRDAAAQQAAAQPVLLGEERPGDLYFFASNGRVTHVGFVTGARRMLHAPEYQRASLGGGGVVEEAPLDEERTTSLRSAGRFW